MTPGVTKQSEQPSELRDLMQSAGVAELLSLLCGRSQAIRVEDLPTLLDLPASTLTPALNSLSKLGLLLLVDGQTLLENSGPENFVGENRPHLVVQLRPETEALVLAELRRHESVKNLLRSRSAKLSAAAKLQAIEALADSIFFARQSVRSHAAFFRTSKAR